MSSHSRQFSEQREKVMPIEAKILEKIRAHALDALQWRKYIDPRRVSLAIHTEGMEQGEKLRLGWERAITLVKPTAVLLVDLAPDFNWGHDCELHLYDAANGELYSIVRSQFPPDHYFSAPNSFMSIHAPVPVQ